MQGLFPSTNKLDIHVMDISSNALSSAKKAWEELDTEGESHLVTYHQSFETLPKSIEIVIVSIDRAPQIATSDNIVVSPNVKISYFPLRKENPRDSALNNFSGLWSVSSRLNGAKEMKIPEIK